MQAADLPPSHVAPTRAEILRGLQRRDFFFHFQPILELQTARQVGAEMLIRWVRGGELLLPARFFPALEQHHLLKNLDQFVIQQVRALAWDHVLHPTTPFRVFINVSTESISDEAFLAPMETIAEHLRPFNLIPVVELSERSLFDPHLLMSGLTRLRERGVEIALDDFGAGYSSLARLVNLPLDILKIDRYLTAGIGQSERGEVILDSVLALAEKIGFRIVVEGVETRYQAEWLAKNLGCWVQGYYFGYPAPMDFSAPAAGAGGKG